VEEYLGAAHPLVASLRRSQLAYEQLVTTTAAGVAVLLGL
jgi:hypothetical protein